MTAAQLADQLLKAQPRQQELVNRLAKLSPIDVRFSKKAIAEEYKDLGLTPSDIIKMKAEIDAQHKREDTSQVSESGSGVSLRDYFEDMEEEPAVEPQDFGAVTGDVAAVLEKAVVFKNRDQAFTCALWALATWFSDRLEYSPYLLITAPMKQCGKSTLMSVLAKLVRRPFPTSSTSASGVFRVMSEFHPTLLMDEADTFLKQNEDLIGLLNAGVQRGTPAVRVEKDASGQFTPTAYDCFGFKAISGINAKNLTETVTDRSIVIELQRRTKDQQLTRLRDIPKESFTDLRSRMAKLAEDCGERVAAARPAIPQRLSDREGDKWFCLLSLGSVSGNADLLKRIECCAVNLSGIETSTSLNDLLDGLKEILNKLPSHQVYIRSSAIIEGLKDDPDDGEMWSTYLHGRPVSTKWLARKLEPFGVRPQKIRAENNVSGYKVADLKAIFERYRTASEEVPEPAPTEPAPATRPAPEPAPQYQGGWPSSGASVRNYPGDDEDMPI